MADYSTPASVSDLELALSGEKRLWNTELSYYRRANNTLPQKTVALSEVVHLIRVCAYAQAVAEVRALAGAGDEHGARKKKRELLPAVSISGQQKTRAAEATEEQRGFRHSGLLQADIDHLTEGEATALRDRIVRDPHVQLAFLSPSGTGVKAIVRIPVCSGEGEHERAFRAVESYLRSKYDISIDKATKDRGRLCYLSSDPDLKFRNEPAQVFQIPEEHFDKCGTRPVTVKHHEPVSAKRLRKILRHIPPSKGYNTWLRVLSAVFNLIDYDTGYQLLQEWDREWSPGLYEEKYRARLTQVGIGSLIQMAQENGYHATAATSKDKHIFKVPSGTVSHSESAQSIFPVIGAQRGLYRRDGVIGEIDLIPSAKLARFTPLTAERFCALVENFGHRVARQEAVGGRTIWRSCRLPMTAAKILLQADAARVYIPPLAQMCACAVLTRGGELLGTGYHEHGGGTFVCNREQPSDVPLDVATASLLSLLKDFAFASEADKSRAIAGMISPALKMGGWITADFPLDLGEGDQSQAGKTLRQVLICVIYGDTPTTVSAPRGGVGSLDESVSQALISGGNFIMLDNFRGRIDSTILEQAIRGAGTVTCRALRRTAQIDTTPFLWLMTTNGAELTRDLTNRAVITRIRKRAQGYRFKQYPEGSIKEHVVANQAFYLGCVFSVLREWGRHGCPRSDEDRHDFREWCSSLDWIVQNIFGLVPLLDGHRAQQMRTATSSLQWLRDIANAVKAAGRLNCDLTTSELLDVAEHADINMPGGSGGHESPCQRAGKFLGRLYRDNGSSVSVDGFTITRGKRRVERHGHGSEESTVYRIAEGDPPPSPASPP